MCQTCHYIISSIAVVSHSDHLHTCFMSGGRGYGGVTGNMAGMLETTVEDSVLTFVSMKPLDISDETSG